MSIPLNLFLILEFFMKPDYTYLALLFFLLVLWTFSVYTFSNKVIHTFYIFPTKTLYCQFKTKIKCIAIFYWIWRIDIYLYFFFFFFSFLFFFFFFCFLIYLSSFCLVGPSQLKALLKKQHHILIIHPKLDTTQLFSKCRE